MPKMADYGYIAVFDKNEARIYNGTTTTISANGEPIIVAPRCTKTAAFDILCEDEPYHLLRRDPRGSKESPKSEPTARFLKIRALREFI